MTTNKVTGEIELGKDARELLDFLTAPRLSYCLAFTCIHHDDNDALCNLRRIPIDDNGRCKEFERKSEPQL